MNAGSFTGETGWNDLISWKAATAVIEETISAHNDLNLVLSAKCLHGAEKMGCCLDDDDDGGVVLRNAEDTRFG